MILFSSFVIKPVGIVLIGIFIVLILAGLGAEAYGTRRK